MADARPVLVRMAMLSNGTVAKLERSRGGESEHVGPSGESRPLHERWAALIASASDAGMARERLEAARAELHAQLRRPLAPDTTETLEELCSRIVDDGWGITAREAAMAMRCTPTLVRQARLLARRHPETGYGLPDTIGDPWSDARRLDAAGLSVRHIEVLTGLPRRSLYRALK